MNLARSSLPSPPRIVENAAYRRPHRDTHHLTKHIRSTLLTAPEPSVTSRQPRRPPAAKTVLDRKRTEPEFRTTRVISEQHRHNLRHCHHGGAGAHAQAQHGHRAEFMRYIQHERSARTLPPVSADQLGVVETVAPGGCYSSAVLTRGTGARGFHHDRRRHALSTAAPRRRAPHEERLNVADTVKSALASLPGQWASPAQRVRAGAGHRHDRRLRCLPRYLPEHPRGQAIWSLPRRDRPESAPAGRELFLAALKHGLDRRDLPPSVSFFQGVRVQPDGAFAWLGSAGPGTTVDLLHVDCIVLVANTAHPLDPRPSSPAPAADPRLAGPRRSGPPRLRRPVGAVGVGTSRPSPTPTPTSPPGDPVTATITADPGAVVLDSTSGARQVPWWRPVTRH